MSSLRGLPLRVVLGVMLLVSLLVAGGVSLLASGKPDGLNRVAQDEGFADTESDHAVGDGPLAGLARPFAYALTIWGGVLYLLAGVLYVVQAVGLLRGGRP